jgi:hypothetical protein
MRIEIKDFVIETKQDEYDRGFVSFDEVLYEAVERARAQLKDDLTAHIKRMFLDDSRVKAYIEVTKEKMINNLEEK